MENKNNNNFGGNNGGNNNNFNNNLNKNNTNPIAKPVVSVTEGQPLNKKVLYYGLGAVAIVIVIFLVVKEKSGALVGNVDQKVDQTVTLPAAEISKDVKKPGVSISYAEALVKYCSKINDYSKIFD